MGSRGIKQRKPAHPLPKVRGDLPLPEANQATALSPMGAIHALGNIARATNSPHQRERRAALSLGFVIALPLVLIAIGALIVLATR